MHNYIDISIIIPLYNTEKYIGDTLQSIFKQRKQPIEIIIIDDGSTDNSLQIVTNFQKKYNHIILYRQKNSGPAAARNFGIQQASGKYIMFVDSDDILPKNAIELLYQKIESSQTQVSIGMMQSFNKHKKWIHSSMEFFIDMHKDSINLNSCPELINNMSPCNKLYLRDFIVRNHLHFLESVHLREDIYFVSNVLYKAKKISIIPNIIYLYRGRDEQGISLTSQINAQVFDDIITVSNMLDKDQKNSAYKDNNLIYKYRYINELNALAYRLWPYAKTQTLSMVFLQKIQFFLKKLGLKPLYAQALEKRMALFDIYNGEFDAAIDKIQKTQPKPISLRKKTQIQILRKLKIIFWHILYFTVPILSFIYKTPPRIWLIGEQRGEGAKDNGYIFFLYCRNKYPNIPVYFVTKQANITKELTQYKDHILTYGSLKNYLFSMKAEVYIYTDGYKDIFPYWPHGNNQFQPTLTVFLQHGVSALKKTSYYHSSTVQKRGEKIDLFVVSSNKEKKYITQEWEYPKCIMGTSGLARFDRLYANSNHPLHNKILFIPTWRPYLRYNNDEIYLDSLFHKKLSELVYNKKFIDLLKKHEYILHICFHHAFSKFTKHYQSSKYIKISNMATVDVYNELISSRMMITDYSSVAFDMAFLDRPVAFYQFDTESFFVENGGDSFIDFNKELFGLVSESAEDIINEVKYNIDNNFKVKKEHQIKANTFFKYKDNRNCERILHITEKKLAKKIKNGQ